MGMLGNDLDTTDGVVLLSEDQDTQSIQMQVSDVFAQVCWPSWFSFTAPCLDELLAQIKYSMF